METGRDGAEPSNLQKQHREKAIEFLRQSIAAGWKDFAHMRKDSDLEPIGDNPEFKRLVEEGQVDEAGSAEGAAK